MSARRSRPSSAATARDARPAAAGGGSHLGHISTALPPGLSHAGGAITHHASLVSSPSSATLSSRPRPRDSEELVADVRSLKEESNAIRAENAYLKTQMQRLLAQIRRKDKQIDQLAALKISAVNDSGGDAILAGQIRELRAEMTTIARLTDKFREVEATLQRRDEELRRIRSSTKVLSAAEAEMEAQLYYNEARRMKAGVALLQSQVSQLSAQLRESQGLKPGDLKYSRPLSASPYNGAISPSAAAASAARDHELFASLRAEVASLRAENRRLAAAAAEADGNGANGTEAGSGRLHVLNGREEQQRSKHNHASASAGDDADYASDSAEYDQYESVPINGQHHDQPQHQHHHQHHQAEDDGGVPEQFEEPVDS